MTKGSIRERVLSTLAVAALVFLSPCSSRGQFTPAVSAEDSQRLTLVGDDHHGNTMPIPKGFRVVTVKIDDSGRASQLRPVDRVDVLVNVQRNPSTQIERHTILRDIRVFAVGTLMNNDSEVESTPIKSKTASLLVTPKQPEVVMLASEVCQAKIKD